MMLSTGTCSKASIQPPAYIPVQSAVATKSKPPVGLPEQTVQKKPELYRHQKEIFEYFKDKSEMALLMEMGTGKSATVLAIASYKFKHGMINALLIIAPNDVHKQWATEQIPLWLDVPYDIQLFGGRGGAKETYPFDDDPDKLQIVVTNVDTFSTPHKWEDITEWANSKNTFIVLDEATVIKNVNAMRTQRLLYEFNAVERRRKVVLSSKPLSVARAILTGTPITNGPMDLWALMEFLRPNYFYRNYYSFQNYFGMFTTMEINGRRIAVPLNAERWQAIKNCKTYEMANMLFGCSADTYDTVHSQSKFSGPHKHADELRAAIAPVSKFKRLVQCVDMPKQVYTAHEIMMSPEQRKCYDSMADEFLAEYDGKSVSALNKLTAMIRLQQISSGFIVPESLVEQEARSDEEIIQSLYGLEEIDFTPGQVQWIGKSVPKLERLYSDVAEISKPVIIITRFSAEAARIFDDLSKTYSCCLVTGWKRVGDIEDFKKNEYDVMVANIASIAKGFNLQNSNSIMFYSNTFSLENRLQAEGRIFRLGQHEVCSYTDYINKDSVDEQIVSALSMKRDLLDFIRGADIKELLRR
jgi:SNF2 family DNA or RNA helicase